MTVDYLKMLKRTDKLQIHTDLDTLDLYCEYLLNYNNKTINYSNLANLKEYFSRMSEDVFKQNESKMARYFFIKFYLEARLDKGIAKHGLCIQYVMDHVSKRYTAIIKREILDSIESNEMSKEDIEFMNQLVFSQLNTIFMHDYKKAIMKMMEDLNSNEFGKDAGDVDNAIQLFQALLNDLTRAQRRSKKENRFDLSDEEHFNMMMQEAIDRALSDAHYWQTGWQGLNKMLGGGFEDARLYNFIGATGGFKSGLLLNLMKQIKLYNKGRPHKDPTKRPTILFLSQENNIWETFLRIFGIFGTTENIRNFDPKQIMKILSKGGFCSVQDELDIDIEFRYYGNQDISVDDVKGIVQEMENSGKEVIIIIQDYIERLRPPMVNTEKRNQLADVSNKLHDLAIELDVPIITASQFNREGVDMIEQARGKNVDVGWKVGTGNISESFGMLKNFDMNISIVVEYDSNEHRFYLSFRRLKMRGDDSKSIEYFLQPFVGQDSKIQLMDDIYTTPVYRLSMLDEVPADMAEAAQDINMITRRGMTLLPENNNGPLDSVTTDPYVEDASAFMAQTFYDIDHSAASQDDMPRDQDGFIILIPKIPFDKLKTNQVKIN